jgi:very-short-patch-repair endonuclease
VIEVDGTVHALQKDADIARQEILELLGPVVLRIDADMVEKNLPMALSTIRNSIETIKRIQLQNIPSP